MLHIRYHILFWLAIVILLTALFGGTFESHILSFYFVSMLLPVAVGTSYFFNYFLVPQYLLQKRYGLFALYVVYMLVISTWLEMLVITGSFVLLADYDYSVLSPVVTNIFLLAVIIYFVVFLKAFFLLVQRSFSAQQRTASLESERDSLMKGFLTVRADRQQAMVMFEDIRYLESMGDYVRIHIEDRPPVITRERIGHLADILPSTFLRIHRSFIVHTGKVSRFSRTELQVGEETLPISRTYKKEAGRRLGSGPKTVTAS